MFDGDNSLESFVDSWNDEDSGEVHAGVGSMCDTHPPSSSYHCGTDQELWQWGKYVQQDHKHIHGHTCIVLWLWTYFQMIDMTNTWNKSYTYQLTTEFFNQDVTGKNLVMEIGGVDIFDTFRFSTCRITFSQPGRPSIVIYISINHIIY